jgi:hypothetical protein
VAAALAEILPGDFDLKRLTATAAIEPGAAQVRAPRRWCSTASLSQLMITCCVRGQ